MSITWHHYKNWLKKHLCNPLPEHLPTPQPSDIAIDTRSSSPRSWFLPLQGNNVNGIFSNGQKFSTYVPNDPNLIEKLSDKGVRISEAPL